MLHKVVARLIQIDAQHIFFEEKNVPAEHSGTLASRIWFVNKDSRFDTSNAREVHNPSKSVTPPPGLSVLELINPVQCLDEVISDLDRLFSYHNRNTKSIEFTTRNIGVKALFSFRNTERVVPNYHRIVSKLQMHQPHLVGYIQEHVFAAIEGETQRLETVNIEIMQYQPGSFFKSHIDNVVQTGDEPWPVYAIHVGRKTKRFDLLPVFRKDLPAIRVLVEPGQTVLLDGSARLDYSHAIPAAREWAYTIRFHFKPTPICVSDNIVLFPQASLNDMGCAMLEFDELYNKAPLFQAFCIPFKCVRLVPDSENWRFTSRIDFEEYKSASERIWFVNQWLSKRKCISNMNFATDERVECPDGIHLIQRLPVKDLARSAARELSELFMKERGSTNSTASSRKSSKYKQSLELLFNSRNIFLPEAIKFLFSEGYYSLVTFILIHVKALIHLLGEDKCVSSTCLFSVVRYTPKIGMKVHIDGVEAIDQEFGPVMTIPMGPGPKSFDLFPTLIHENAIPVRITSNQFQPTLMQGSSRMEYSHGVPFGQIKEHMSILFRFKDFSKSQLPKTIKFNPLLGHTSTTIIPQKPKDDDFGWTQDKQ
jgi:alkylated DNA repair dioxygenase AlkB